MHARRLPGFTLIELLVVISIVTLLMALLLPMLTAARAAIKQTLCLSNMRQLGIATSNYIADQKGYYPQPSTDSQITDVDQRYGALWFNALDYYLAQERKDYAASERNYNSFKQDPSWQELPKDPVLGVGNDQIDVRTIRMNEWFGHINISDNPSASYRFFREPDIDTPISRTVMFADGRAHDTPAPSTGAVDVTSAGHFYISEIRIGLRHNNGANVTFADGHAALHKDAIRTMATGYQGWHIGDTATNGYNGSADGIGPHELYWRFGRGLH